MKTLELNEMESLQGGGDAECKMAMGMYAIVGGILGGPWGYFLGLTLAYAFDENCQES